MKSPRLWNTELPAFFCVILAVALTYRLFPGEIPWCSSRRWDPKQLTIKGFRAGVTREQIEARLGPASEDSEGLGWTWYPPQKPASPGSPLPTITFELLTLYQWKGRWYLSGSQFECEGEKFITQIHCADSIGQGTVQRHFGPGSFEGNGNEFCLKYPFPDESDRRLSFNINLIDEFGPPSSRSVTGTTLSWPVVPSPHQR